MTIISPLSLIIQRLQYQGWLAVVANLEDLVTDLKKTGKQMETTFDNYLGKRESYQAQIETFDDDVAVLLQVIRITENEKRTFLGKLFIGRFLCSLPCSSGRRPSLWLEVSEVKAPIPKAQRYLC